MKTSIIAAAALALAACGKEEPPQAPNWGDQPPAAQTQAPPAHDNGMWNMLLGGAIGYMMGSSSRAPTPAPVVIDRRTTIIEAPRPAAVAVPTPAPAPKPAAVTPPVREVPNPMPAPKPNFGATTQPYVVKQNTPTYTAPPTRSYVPPAATRSYSAPSPSRSFSSGRR